MSSFMKSTVIAPAAAAIARRSGTVSMAITRSAPSRKALRMANCADRAAAEYRDRLAAFDVAELGAHVAGREDVGQEQHLLVAQARPAP